MSRALFKGIFHKHPMMVKLVGNFTVGAAGAVSSYDFPGASVARTSEGKYTITLADKYRKFLGGTVTVLKTSVANAMPQINSASVGTPTVVIDFYSVDESPNVLRDPDSTLIYVELTVGLSSASV